MEPQDRGTHFDNWRGQYYSSVCFFAFMIFTIFRSNVQFSPNTRYLLVATLNNRITLWDLTSTVSPSVVPKLLKVYIGHKNEKYCIFSLFFERWILSGSENQTIKIWNLNTPDVSHTIDSGQSGTTFCCFILTLYRGNGCCQFSF